MLTPVDRETEEELRERVDVDELERHVDAFDGTERVSGTDDEWEASEYVVETLREYGCEAELLDFEGYISVPEDGRLDVTAPTRETFDEAITTSFGASTPPGGVSGEVVRVEEVTEQAVAAADLEGKIAFTTGLPTPEPITLFEAAGAEAVVYQSVNPDQLHEMIVTPVWGTPGLDDEEAIPDVPVVEITHDVGDWLVDRCDEGPVEATVTTEVTTELTTLPCPVGRVEGTDSDRYMVVGNHVDSWYEGITDNATAMAATLELARIFAEDPPARGLVFGFWPAHSTGRYAGSAWWADQEWLDLRENGVAYYHLDLNGLQGADGLWHQEMAELGEEHLDVLKTAGDLPLLEGGEAGSSVTTARRGTPISRSGGPASLRCSLAPVWSLAARVVPSAGAGGGIPQKTPGTRLTSTCWPRRHVSRSRSRAESVTRPCSPTITARRWPTFASRPRRSKTRLTDASRRSTRTSTRSTRHSRRRTPPSRTSTGGTHRLCRLRRTFRSPSVMSSCRRYT